MMAVVVMMVIMMILMMVSSDGDGHEDDITTTSNYVCGDTNGLYTQGTSVLQCNACGLAASRPKDCLTNDTMNECI
jgi:hypothetical protein